MRLIQFSIKSSKIGNDEEQNAAETSNTDLQNVISDQR